MGKRAKVVAEIERGLTRLADQPGLCLFYAHQAASVLWKHRYRVVIQAGSLQWPRVRREEDDGQMNTHFSYMWTPGAYERACPWRWATCRKCTFGSASWTARRLWTSLPGTCGRRPRPGAWPGARQTRRRIFGVRQPGLPDWVVYQPDRDASIYACTLLKRLFDPIYLRGRR